MQGFLITLMNQFAPSIIAVLIAKLDAELDFENSTWEEVTDYLLNQAGKISNIFLDEDPENLVQLQVYWNENRDQIVERVRQTGVYLIEKETQGAGRTFALKNLEAVIETLQYHVFSGKNTA